MQAEGHIANVKRPILLRARARLELLSAVFLVVKDESQRSIPSTFLAWVVVVFTFKVSHNRFVRSYKNGILFNISQP